MVMPVTSLPGAVQVSACPGGAVAGYTYFIPSEEHLESRVTTRGFMEARMVVALAGRRDPAPFAVPSLQMLVRSWHVRTPLVECTAAAWAGGSRHLKCTSDARMIRTLTRSG